MKEKNNQAMKKNLEDLRNHVSKQATGRAPSMPTLGGVRRLVIKSDLECKSKSAILALPDL